MMGTAKAGTDLERRKVESLTGELLAVYEELALLHSLGAQLGPLSDEEQVCAVALREAMEVLRGDCGWVVLWKNGIRRIPEGCRIQIDLATLDRVTDAVLAPSRERGVSQVLLHQVVLHDVDGSRLAGPDAPGRLLACSLSVRGMPLAYISVGRRSDGPKFTSADRKLLTAVSSFTGVA
ncbi:MAG: GAF domain-containing protein, partial [Bryobacteraceae bacterium]